jgi:CDGSH-type Zn-finger protein/uncharacterized Fe-S cluster protein YjdI
MSDKEIYQFPGKDVDVTWDGRLCIHIGECGQASGDLFIGGRQPWCQPDLVEHEHVMDVCERCPSGALTYTMKTGNKTELADKENTVQIVYNGPYYVRGDLVIEDADDIPGVRYRAALCRCGQSKNKPFCDNSHEKIEFKDYGAVGEEGDGLKSSGGPVNIKLLKDGPLLLSGNITIKAGSGRNAWRGDNAALCRCGASKNKPFCDGSHKQAGFKSG